MNHPIHRHAPVLLATGFALSAACSPPAPVDHATYWRDVAPILAARCVSCHTAGGIGPMPLTTYAEARPVAPLMARETGTRAMPPWPPSTDLPCRPLQNAKNLTDHEIDLIADWSQHGTPEGNPADYRAPTIVPEGRMLPPSGDLSLAIPGPYEPVSTGGRDDYHCFVLDPQLATSRDVIGVRVTPGNARIVHHALLYAIRPESLAALQQLDDATPEPGYPCFGGTGIPVRAAAAPAGSTELADFNQQGIGGWAPGSEATYLPEGTGIRLAAGSRIVIQLHYSLANEPSGATDQTHVDLYYSPQPVASPALWMYVANGTFTIPAGVGPLDPRATTSGIQTPFASTRLFGVAPHMHLLGQSIRVDLLHGIGTADCLVNIPDWNFHWQQSYWFREPMNVVAGADSFQVTCTYDNTVANQPAVNGVPQQPHDLHWGENTSDEMCLAFLYIAR